MKPRICFIHRKNPDTPSIERVFSVIENGLRQRGIEVTTATLSFGNSLSGIIRNLVFFRRPDADIYHITGHVHYMALRLPPERTVLTVHDLGILKTRRGLRRTLIKYLFFKWPFRRLRFITAISDATKRDILGLVELDSGRVRLINDPLSLQVSVNRRPFDSKKPTILQVGTAPHKNLESVIAAIVGLTCKLIVVGDLCEGIRSQLIRLQIDFDNVAADSDTAMLRIYEQSDLLVFCSTFEGFGLPIIEAQAMRIPVITSDIAPMNDVAGDAALLVDPYNISEIRTAIETVIGDASVRDGLIQKGIANIRRFEPSAIIDQYLGLYRQIFSKDL